MILTLAVSPRQYSARSKTISETHSDVPKPIKPPILLLNVKLKFFDGIDGEVWGGRKTLMSVHVRNEEMPSPRLIQSDYSVSGVNWAASRYRISMLVFSKLSVAYIMLAGSQSGS